VSSAGRSARQSPSLPASKQVGPSAPTCISCESNLLCPTKTGQVGPSLWRVGLRCPECGWRGSVNYTEAQLKELDRELDRAASNIEDQLGRMEAMHMEEWATLFLRALELDLIGPDDF
jgi:hypothetical protein